MSAASWPLRMVRAGAALAAALLSLTAHAEAAGLETTAVGYQTQPSTMTFDGVVEAVRKATVSAQTSGRVTEIHFDVDDYVPKGSVLMRLRDTEQRAQQANAEAGLREAQAIHDKSRAEYERVREVHARGLVAKAALDQAESDFRASEQRLKAAQARLEQSGEQLGYTVIRAPYSGVLVERHVEVGEAVQAGQPLMTGHAADDMRVVTAVPQSVIDRVRRHNRAEVWIEAQSVAVKGLTFFPHADPATHAFKVRLALPAGLTGVYPGMMVKVRFVVGEERRLIVDERAVAYRSEVTGLYVVEDGRLSFRQVRLGRLADGAIEVLSGVREGERVAIDPVRAAAVLKDQRAGGKR